MDKLREETIRNVRCCLVIVKGALELNQLARDYRTFINNVIPFKKLGHESLEAFLRGVDGLIVRKVNGQVFVDAKPDPRSSHISTMVQRQKPAKRKRGPTNVMSRPYYNSPKSPVFKTFNGPNKSVANQIVPKTNVNKARDLDEKNLLDFTRILNLSQPVVKVLERKSKNNKLVQFDCKIKVDGIIYSSYPGDFHDAKSATQQASVTALQALVEKYGGKGEILPVATESSIVTRIPPLVGKHINGVWSWQVQADYKDLYRETLPGNWLQIIKDQPGLSVEQFGPKFVMQVIRPENKSEKEGVAHSCEVSIPTTTASFDEKGYMTAKIVCPVSAGEIWCRQLDTPGTASFDAMSEHMNEHYQEMYEKHAIRPQGRYVAGSYYAVWEQDWHRVRALEILEDGVVCLFVDRGGDLIVDFENIFTLERIYAHEPAQAFVCKLDGLEDIYDVECPEDIMALEGAEVTLEMVDNASEEDAQKIYTVEMYDVETGIACNKDLMIAIAMEDVRISFKTNDTLEVHISHVCKNGLIYVQIVTHGFQVLMNLVQQLEAAVPRYLAKHKTPEVITGDNSKGKIYYAKLEDDEGYHRVQIIDSPENFQYALVLYIDIGRTRVVKMSDVTLLPLDVLNPALSKFPAQATMARMNLQRIPDDLPAKMKEYVSPESNVLLRVQSKDDAGVPNVMLFVPHVNGLVSVNDSLTISMGKYSKDTQLSPLGVLTPPPSPQSVLSTGVLKCPRIPHSGQSFLVKIPIAVNPWSFFVQPLESTSRLNEMMAKMRETFSINLMDSVGLRDIKEGNIYAAKGNDDMWYRVCVLKAIYPTAIVVFYVDYGNYSSLCYQQLYLLDEKFMELPYQAIRAKLAGIKPIQEKWSIDDGRYFENMVKEREYMCTIVTQESDELNTSDKVMVIKLKSNQNLQVGDWLIHKKLAVKD